MSTTSATIRGRPNDVMPSFSGQVNDPTPPTALVNLYHLLTKAIGPVADMDAGDPELPRQVATELHDTLQQPAARLAAAWDSALTDRESLTVAHAQLFLGPFEMLAPPYESLYLDPERRLMGQVSQAVARAYANAGLGPAAGPQEVPDHITRELEFMYFTGFQAIRSGQADWSYRGQRFWNDHLGRWLPLLAANIADANVHPFYNTVAEVLDALNAVELARNTG